MIMCVNMALLSFAPVFILGVFNYKAQIDKCLPLTLNEVEIKLSFYNTYLYNRNMLRTIIFIKINQQITFMMANFKIGVIVTKSS